MSGLGISEEEVFLAARELDEPGKRAAYLDQVCGDRLELRHRIERLLAASRSADALLERSDVPGVLGNSASTLTGMPVYQLGSRVGHYQLLEKIGEGGFGLVFMAEQREPIRRKVALKLIKPGMDTTQVLARFDAERQALALMDDPHIAKVLDAGATDLGHPYFVMELVRGVPITQFCEENKVSLQDRLELFLPVCRAIQHAHQKGVIHRDIKPSNILVSLDYGEPLVKVIDFGVAKAIGPRLTDRTLFTQFTQMIGTPAYMSPEQAEMSNLDVDTRTDVYSLGVLLYELLTGTTPFPEKELLSRGLDDMRRVIREEEPERPSVRTSRRRDPHTGGWHERPGRRSDSLQGDLDWIVLRAIEKDRRRRYDTPLELASDVQRHLSSEPVLARPPTSLYRLQKFFNRHKTGAAAGLVVSMAILVGFSAALIGFERAHQESQRALREEAVAKAVVEFLEQKLLGAADINQTGAYGSPERDLRVMTVVNRAAAQIDDSFPGQPLVEAAVRLTLGKVYRGLGETDRAEHHVGIAVRLFEEGAGPEDPRTLEAKHTLTVLLHHNRFALREAGGLAREVASSRERVLGPNDASTLASLLELAWIRLDLQDLNEASSLFEEVEQRAKAARSGNRPSPIELDVQDRLARMAWERGEQDVAMRLTREVYQQRKATQGMTNVATLSTLGRLAFVMHQHERNYHEAEALVEEGLEHASRILDDWGPAFDLRRHLAVLRGQKGLFLESEALRRENLRLALEKAGPHHPTSLLAAAYLAFVHAHYGQDEVALPLLEETLLTAEKMRLTSWSTKVSHGWLASLYWRHGRRDEALTIRERQAAATRSVFGEDTRFTAGVVSELADIHARMGSWQDAAEVLATVAGRAQHNAWALAHAALAHALAGEAEQAKELCQSALSQVRDNGSTSDAMQVKLTALVLLPSVVITTDLQSIEGLGRFERRLWDGTIDARAGRHRAALDQLTPIAEFHPEPSKRGLAGYFCAIAAHHLGDPIAALEWTQVSGELLTRVLAGGDLGREWVEIARVLVVREEAERLVKTEASSPAVNSDSIRRADDAWRPVHALLQRASHSARRQDWGPARDSYLTAIKTEPFTWEAAELLYPRLTLKMAITFALAGDSDAYARLSRHFAGLDADLDEHFVEISLLPDDWNGIDQPSLVLHAQQTADVPESEGVRHAPEWEQVLVGLELIKEGDFEPASQAFRQAQSAYSLACAGVAYAYDGRLRARHGDQEGATKNRAQAQANLDQLRQNHGEDWGKYWFEMAWLQLALNSR